MWEPVSRGLVYLCTAIWVEWHYFTSLKWASFRVVQWFPFQQVMVRSRYFAQLHCGNLWDSLILLLNQNKRDDTSLRHGVLFFGTRPPGKSSQLKHISYIYIYTFFQWTTSITWLGNSIRSRTAPHYFFACLDGAPCAAANELEALEYLGITAVQKMGTPFKGNDAWDPSLDYQRRQSNIIFHRFSRYTLR